MDNLDEIFRELEKAGRNDVNNLIKWMEDSKVLDSFKEDRVRKLFADVSNANKVELEKFKEVLAKLAAEQHKSFEQLQKQLIAEAPNVVDAAIEGLQAFKEALKAGKK